MASNFTFLERSLDTQDLYDTAKDAEDLYRLGKFANEYESIRKVAENVARIILDFNYISMDERSTFNDCLREIKHRQLVSSDLLDIFYNLKNVGNSAAHTLHKYTKSEGLQGLRQLYILLAWFANTYTDEHVSVESFIEPKENSLYQTTNSRKVIYVQTADNKDGNWPAYIGLEKIGDATTDDLETDNTPNSKDLRKVAENRINQYMKTAGVPHKLQWAELAYRKTDHTWFRDYDVHDVLDRSNIEKTEVTEGNEWYKTDVETAKRAIKAVKEGRKSLDNLNSSLSPIKITLRPEQQDAVDKTKKAFKSYDKMLWNAKMRFGKTLSALQLVKDEEYQHVLIMTHRPVVDQGWFEDFKKICMPEDGYLYGSKKDGEDFDYLTKSGKPFVYFASLQDLRGSKLAGGSAGDKNEALFNTKWDLVIVDEAHEGTQTELAKNVTDLVVGKDTKLLELSGTPFNILDQYEDDQVYTWDYVNEQKAKYTWSKEHPHEKNPYQGLPRVNMFTFEMGSKFTDLRFQSDDKRSFNFKEFFKVDDQGNFVYQKQVEQFLNNITTPDEQTNYPYSTKEFRDRLRHTLWIMPGVKEANALEKMLKKHPVFGMEYQIVNVVKNGDNEGVASESDVDLVNDAIGKDPAKTKTITLTVRKLTTGVTIKPWTGVLFLSNTNSAMQYLQAAFRAQTPYSSESFGEKTDCYIFDFAPDRALTVMAAATQLNTGVGKRTSSAQKYQMAELMNFLPIVGETGNGMKPFKVDSMLAKIKRVYAEKAVRTGFDDDSLYSDELLMIKDADLKAFNDLKAIIGTTKSKKPLKVDVNNQGLTDEEYDQAQKGEKKKKRERTTEEQAAMDKIKQLKKQRKTMISILRSISIRIPMMIYGMDVELDEDVNINKFIDKVDDQSWQEFMPKGVTKELFKEFSKYYDQDVFIEAGKIIRNRVKALDESDPIERTRQLALIFGTFRNPDKETVLTPWRVVNMHLGKTIGGYSFYDDNYQNTTVDGVDAAHWVHTDYTEQAFNRNAHVLEINSKTGLYPLYVATSRYFQEYGKQKQATAGNVSLENKRMLWQQILRENIFCVAKTPMAKEIAKRTLTGYQDYDTNIIFVDNIVEGSKQNVKAEAKKIREVFGNLKFDVVIGNPPYQQTVAKKETSNGQARVASVFQYFQELSDELAEKYVSLIYPGKRWLHQSGKGMKHFGKSQINDPHLAKLIYFEDASKVFPGVEIADGITIVFKNKLKETQNFDYEFHGSDGTMQRTKLQKPGDKLLILNPQDNLITEKLDKFVSKYKLHHISDSEVINQKLFRIESSFVEDHPEEVRPLTNNDHINNDEVKLLTNDKAGKGGKAKWFITKRSNIPVHKELINKWMVIVSSANAGGQKRDNQIQIIDDKSAFGRSRIALKAFDSSIEAENFLKYAKSYLIRYTFLLTDESLSSLGKEVPDLLDYTSENQFIDYSKPIDNQLYTLFDLDKEQINHIEKTVNNIR